MQKILIYTVFVLFLAGCAHKIDIQQGNILTQAELAKLQEGMSKRQVLFLIGSPLLSDPFHQNRWDYYYSFKPGGGEVTSRYLATLWFDGDRLTRYTAGGAIPEETPLAPRLEER